MNPLLSHFTRFDPETGIVEGVPGISRRLADLRGAFTDEDAYEAALRRGNPVVYTVSSVSAGTGEGALHYGIGVLYPGTIGQEYFLTKGHLHSWRAAAEVYVGLKGEGKMLLEDEATGGSTIVDLLPNSAVYVPGHTAHRTVNVGATPLVYIGVYPAEAGHEYREIAKKNFRMMMIEVDGKPVAVKREEYLKGGLV
ncbi:MAG: pgiA [Bacteroidetes bacterium]|jgi:glucose-6-phosphate isomerase|nr:pgiA [Bacteroidota bacterium]